MVVTSVKPLVSKFHNYILWFAVSKEIVDEFNIINGLLISNPNNVYFAVLIFQLI